MAVELKRLQREVAVLRQERDMEVVETFQKRNSASQLC
jgi:hypothetical protein